MQKVILADRAVGNRPFTKENAPVSRGVLLFKIWIASFLAMTF